MPTLCGHCSSACPRFDLLLPSARELIKLSFRFIFARAMDQQFCQVFQPGLRICITRRSQEIFSQPTNFSPGVYQWLTGSILVYSTRFFQCAYYSGEIIGVEMAVKKRCIRGMVRTDFEMKCSTGDRKKTSQSTFSTLYRSCNSKFIHFTLIDPCTKVFFCDVGMFRTKLTHV